MKEKKLSELSVEELLEEQKKTKSNNKINAFLIGLFVGVAVYSAVKNGFGFFTFFPLFFVYVLFNNLNKIKAVEKELKSRG